MRLVLTFPFFLFVGSTSCAATSSPGHWTSLAPIPLYPRQEHAAVSIAPSSIYILGGIVPELAGEIFPTVNFMQRYSIRHNTWESVAPLPLPLNHPNTAVVGGKIYLLGGLTPQDGAWVASRSCYVYDPVSDRWTPLGDMPAGRQVGSAAVGVSGTTIYLAGGLSMTNITSGEQPTVDIVTSYDVRSKRWTNLPSMPAPRDHAGAGLVGRKLYVLGGRSFGNTNIVNTVFSYNLDTRVWKSNLSPLPVPRGGVASATMGRKIYIMGGEGNPEPNTKGVFNQTEVYDTKRNTWQELAPLDVPRHGTAAVAIGKKIYVPGGGLQQGGEPTDIFSYFQQRWR